MKALCLFGLAIGMTACSGPMIRVEHDRSTSFDALHTYAWNSPAGQTTGSLPNDPTLDARIKSAVDAVLQSKGLRSVADKNADLTLEYAASAEKKVDSDLKNYQTAEWMGMTYTLGTLRLKMMRSSSSKIVWEGTVQTNIDLSKPVEERDKELRRAVEKLLAKFPPQ